jgi:D-serine deaminase-like pyridoxal phosphate-dependent protein
MPSYAEYRNAFEGIPKPFAFLDLDLLEQNIRHVLTLSGSKQIRVASKSIRSREVLRKILDSDPRFIGVMCYTAAEAIYLADHGYQDLLLGYPVWDAEAIKNIARKVAEGSQITLMVDSVEHVDHIERIAKQTGCKLPLCIDLDLSMDYMGLHFGVWRSPVRTVADGIRLAERISSSSHVFLDGIMGYEAQIAGVGDANPSTKIRNQLVRYLKRKSIKQLSAIRAELVHTLHAKGIALRFINGGGSGSLSSTSREEVVTEVAVGSAFYSPLLFDYYDNYKFQPAAGYAIEIVRKPKADIYTCLGGGYTASGSIALDKQPMPYLPEGAQLMPMEGAGEVQTPVLYRGSENLKYGDPIFMRHSKAGELCERFTELHLLSQGKVIQTISTYRGEGRCFL